MALRLLRNSTVFRLACQTRLMSSGEYGSGAGQGGGTGGTIRDAGGSLGKREAAQEEMYFRKLQQQQLEALKESLHDEIDHHKEQIDDHESAMQLEALHEHHVEELKHLEEEVKEHQEAIERHKKKIADLKKLEKKD